MNRGSHERAISNLDAPNRSVELRSSSDVAAEASRAQEWCLHHLGQQQQPAWEPPAHQRSRQRASAHEVADRAVTACSAWVPPDGAAAELELDGAVAAHVPAKAQCSTIALIEAARRTSELPSLLAAVQVIAERAPSESDELLRAGVVPLLQAALARADAFDSAAATHRICYATRCVLEAAPAASGNTLRAAIVRSELARLASAALRRYDGVAPLCVDALGVLRALSARGGSSAAAAVVESGAVSVILQVLSGAGAVAEVHAAGAAALAALLANGDSTSTALHANDADLAPSPSAAPSAAPAGPSAAAHTRGCAPPSSSHEQLVDGKRRDAIARTAATQALAASAIPTLSAAIQAFPAHAHAVDGALRALWALLNALSPSFDSLWPAIELDVDAAVEAQKLRTSARAGGVCEEYTWLDALSARDSTEVLASAPTLTAARTRAARHSFKSNVHLVTMALLMGRSPLPELPRCRTCLGILSALARLASAVRHTYPKLLEALERTLPAAAAPSYHLSYDRLSARFSTELWALLPPVAPASVPTRRLQLRTSLGLLTPRLSLLSPLAHQPRLRAPPMGTGDLLLN